LPHPGLSISGRSSRASPTWIDSLARPRPKLLWGDGCRRNGRYHVARRVIGDERRQRGSGDDLTG
jgi:hypothetical protein